MSPPHATPRYALEEAVMEFHTMPGGRVRGVRGRAGEREEGVIGRVRVGEWMG